MFLDSKLDFDKHIERVFDKTSKSIAKLFTRSKMFYRDYLFYKFMNFLLDLTSIIVIISMIRLLQVLFSGHLNPFNIMQLQLVITGAIIGTSRNKTHSELGLESFGDGQHYRKLCVFYKILNSMLPNYLHHMIPSTTRTCASRNVTNIHVVLVDNNYFMNTIFQSTITEWT